MDPNADLMEKVALGLDSLRDAVTDPKVLPYLLSGGAGAAAGGFLTSRTPERPGEDRGARRNRILRNALMLGGATAAGHKLMVDGMPGITTPKPMGGPTAPQAALEGVSKNPLYYGAAGGGLAALVARMSGKEETRRTGSLLHNILGAKKYQELDPAKTDIRNVLTNKVKELTQGGEALKSQGGAPINNSDLRGAGVNGERLLGNTGGGISERLMRGFKSLGQKGTYTGALDKMRQMKMPAMPTGEQAMGAVKSLPGQIKAAPGAAFRSMSPASQEGAKLFGERVTGANRGGGAMAKRLGLLAVLAGVIPQGISRATRAYDPDAFVTE